MFYLLSTPPNREALRHSGGDSLLCTSPTVTLYLEVELSSDRRPGTEQNTSLMLTVTPPIRPSLPSIREPMFLWGMGTGRMRSGYINLYIIYFWYSIEGVTSSVRLCWVENDHAPMAQMEAPARARAPPGICLLFNVARHSHYNIIDRWLARAPEIALTTSPSFPPRPV